MIRTLVPTHDRHVTQRVDPEDDYSGMIEKPESTKEKPQEGVLLACGPGRMLTDGRIIPSTLKPGDKILFGKFAGIDVVIQNQEYTILREDEILCKIEEKLEPGDEGYVSDGASENAVPDVDTDSVPYADR